MARSSWLLLITLVASFGCSGVDDSEDEGGSAAAISESAPAGLKCLATHYGGTPTQTGKGWALQFDGGTSFVWDDQKSKSYDEKLDNPDLEDTLSMPYTMGPATIVTELNKDAGRIRHDGLFKQVLGGSESEVKGNLVSVSFVGQSVKIHKKAADALGRISKRISALLSDSANEKIREFVTGTLGGTFNWRVVANTHRMSAHSYGLAIDLVVENHSDYWEWSKDKSGHFPQSWKHSVPQALVDAFEAEKFVWGGRWYHYDTMHFEYRPELFDSSCTSSKKGADNLGTLDPQRPEDPGEAPNANPTTTDPVRPTNPTSTTPATAPSGSV